MIDRGLLGSVVGVVIVSIVALVAIACTRRRAHLLDDAVSPDALARRVDALRQQLGAREELTDARLARIEQMIEVLSVEMERVGEGQRFVSRILSNDASRS